MSKRELKTQETVTVHPSAQDLAEVFWAMDAEEQAEFFNHLYDISEDKLMFQLCEVSRSPHLLNHGRQVMHEIGEYSDGCGDSQ